SSSAMVAGARSASDAPSSPRRVRRAAAPRPRHGATHDVCLLTCTSVHVRWPNSSSATVEQAGNEPATDSAEPGLLRAQSVMTFSQSRRSYGHVVDGLSHSEVFILPR